MPKGKEKEEFQQLKINLHAVVAVIDVIDVDFAFKKK